MCEFKRVFGLTLGDLDSDGLDFQAVVQFLNILCCCFKVTWFCILILKKFEETAPKKFHEFMNQPIIYSENSFSDRIWWYHFPFKCHCLKTTPYMVIFPRTTSIWIVLEGRRIVLDLQQIALNLKYQIFIKLLKK